jgi:hypothetical protein
MDVPRDKLEQIARDIIDVDWSARDRGATLTAEVGPVTYIVSREKIGTDGSTRYYRGCAAVLLADGNRSLCDVNDTVAAFGDATTPGQLCFQFRAALQALKPVAREALQMRADALEEAGEPVA